MRRRTVDFTAGAGAILLAAVLLIGAILLTSNASFARDYVGDQLTREKIQFKPVDELWDQDVAFTEARTGCLIEYAGQALATGRQAECYANEYIGAHLSYLATRLGMPQIAYADGLTYQELGNVQTDLREEIAAAEESGDASLPALEQELADITTLRTKVFEGSMLRNALLTSYGFSVLGDKAGQVATVLYVAAALLALIGLAMIAHGVVTPKTRAFAPVLQPPPLIEEIPREPVGV